MLNNEQRKYPRVAAGTRVRYRQLRLSDTNPYEEGVLENVSLGGVFIATRHPLRAGTVVELELLLSNDTPEALKSKAVVRWERSRFNPPGMGLQFLEFEGSDRQRLRDWIEQLKAHLKG